MTHYDLLGVGAVAVDECGCTTLTDIFAIGDRKRHPNPYTDGLPIRLESAQNANALANAVARYLTSDSAPYDSVPWCWSNQYDLKLQPSGFSLRFDASIVPGDPATRNFSILYLKDGAVIALDRVNAIKDHVQGRALVERQARADISQMANTPVPLEQLVAI